VVRACRGRFWLEAVESIRCAKEQLSVPRVAASSEDVLPHRIVGDPLTAEISQTQARTVEYQATIAKPRWPSFSPRRRRDVDDFSFDGTPINETYAVLRHLPPGIGEQNRGTQTRYGRWKAARGRRAQGLLYWLPVRRCRPQEACITNRRLGKNG
jgi:hypothetical protein